jgi:hypothetical protein
LAKQTGSQNRNGKGLTSAAENVSDVNLQISGDRRALLYAVKSYPSSTNQAIVNSFV